ncbi:hypothetical protein MDAP_002293 [Mitosporidium daphniae]
MSTISSFNSSSSPTGQNHQFNIILSGDRTIEFYHDESELSVPLPFQKIDKIPRTPLLPHRGDHDDHDGDQQRVDDESEYQPEYQPEDQSSIREDVSCGSAWERESEAKKVWPVTEIRDANQAKECSEIKRKCPIQCCRCQIM